MSEPKKAKRTNRKTALAPEGTKKGVGTKQAGTGEKANRPDIPAWLECAWRRVPCGKKTCNICGNLKVDPRKESMLLNNSDDITALLEDVGESLREALELIKRDAERMGLETSQLSSFSTAPRPSTFPFYKKIKIWRDDVFSLESESEGVGSLWLYTETAADLFWYSNILVTKVYRQLCNRWNMSRDESYGEFDYDYTKYVLDECIGILKGSLQELSLLPTDQKGELMLALSRLARLEKHIHEI